VGEGDPSIMDQPPRSNKVGIVTRSHWIKIGLYGLLITIPVLSAFYLAMRWESIGPERAVTVSFLTLGFAQLWHVFNIRGKDSHIFRNDITRNPFLWSALLLCTSLMLAAVYFRPLGDILKVVDPGLQGWILVLAASITPLLVGQLSLQIGKRFKIHMVSRKSFHV
jgi:Ca2+-transporting ATPase